MQLQTLVATLNAISKYMNCARNFDSKSAGEVAEFQMQALPQMDDMEHFVDTVARDFKLELYDVEISEKRFSIDVFVISNVFAQHVNIIDVNNIHVNNIHVNLNPYFNHVFSLIFCSLGHRRDLFQYEQFPVNMTW